MKKGVVLFAVIVFAVIASLAVADISGQQKLSQARALYASADYEQALAVLKEAAADERAGSLRRDIDVSTFECLVALDRAQEAEPLVESIVLGDPGFLTATADMPPKASAVFRDIRKRILPRVVDQQYVSAKTLLEAKRYAEAAERFRIVLALLEDSDMEHKEGSQEPVSMRVLAQEFHDLAAALAGK